MCQYGKAAIKAAELVRDGDMSPRDAWQEAICIFTKSESSQDKPCPRNAFLGLCEEGMIKGVDPGEYGAGKKNKAYATKAVEILRKEPTLSVNKTKLWKRVKIVMTESGEETSKCQEGRMDVVTALWPKWIRNGGNR